MPEPPESAISMRIYSEYFTIDSTELCARNEREMRSCIRSLWPRIWKNFDKVPIQNRHRTSKDRFRSEKLLKAWMNGVAKYGQLVSMDIHGKRLRHLWVSQRHKRSFGSDTRLLGCERNLVSE